LQGSFARDCKHTATYNTTLQQHTRPYCNTILKELRTGSFFRWATATQCNIQRHTATRCSTLQYTAKHYNTLQHNTMCKDDQRLHHTTAQCSTLQHTATYQTTLQHTTKRPICAKVQLRMRPILRKGEPLSVKAPNLVSQISVMKVPYILWKEPCILWKRPYILTAT